MGGLLICGCVESKDDRERGNVADVHQEAEVVGHTDVGPRVAELAIGVGGENAWTEVGIGVEAADAWSTGHMEDAVEDVMGILVIVPRMRVKGWITVDCDIFCAGIMKWEVGDASGRETVVYIILEGVRWRCCEAVDTDGIIVGLLVGGGVGYRRAGHVVECEGLLDGWDRRGWCNRMDGKSGERTAWHWGRFRRR